MNCVYVVFSPGRTGSHIVIEMLAGSPFTPGGLADAYGIWLPLNRQEYHQHINNQNVVIHLHDINLIKDLNPATVTLIVSLRRDIFAQAMSLSVATVVDEWNGKDYSNKIVEPVVFDPERFTHILKAFVNWQDGLDLSVYKQVVTIYYEDLVNQGAEFLAKELGLDYNKSQVGQVYQKSPYSYKDIIANWPELYQEYLNITNTL